jgi:hypothetical protein
MPDCWQCACTGTPLTQETMRGRGVKRQMQAYPGQRQHKDSQGADFGPAQVLDGLLWNTTRRTAPHSTERPGPKSRAVCRHLPADVLPPQSPQKRVRARPPLMTLGTKRTRGRGLAPEKVKRPKRAEVCSAPRADRLQHVACDDKHFPEPNPKSSASNANSDQTQ